MKDLKGTKSKTYFGFATEFDEEGKPTAFRRAQKAFKDLLLALA